MQREKSSLFSSHRSSRCCPANRMCETNTRVFNLDPREVFYSFLGRLQERTGRKLNKLSVDRFRGYGESS